MMAVIRRLLIVGTGVIGLAVVGRRVVVGTGVRGLTVVGRQLVVSVVGRTLQKIAGIVIKAKFCKEQISDEY